MAETIQTFLLLIAVLAAVAVIARRLDLAPSILLVIAGLLLALVPGLPRIELAPELVLLGILPPLIYSAGVSMSWREFRFNLRPIALLAFGAVIFTTCAVAVAAHYLLGLPWNIGFLLGAIVSPPDVVAPLAIARRLNMPRRILVVLEGEGLANDATALVLYRFAVVAVSTGMFSPAEAAGEFAAIVVGEIAYGVGVGWFSLRLRHLVRDPRVEITLSLITPYLAFLVPQHLGGSGVLATVACGLYVSWNGPLLISSATRLQGIFFWDLFVYLIEGLIFLVMGLQARTLIERAQYSTMTDIVTAILLTTAIVIVARFVWMFPATYLPRWLSPSLRKRDPSPPWQFPFVVAFTGVRGVVSLAAALAIPYIAAAGTPFPYRDLILFVTFGVIIITLVGQGLMLPFVIRALGLARAGETERQREHEAEIAARAAALEASHKRLADIAQESDVPAEVVALLRARHQARTGQLPNENGFAYVAIGSRLRRELIRLERDFVYDLLRRGKITDEARRRIERELDLEEQTVACRDDDFDPPL